ncbi:MAG: type II secretion system protein [Planctomycetes bacterium]|nr:type II secretion system protein [Planctomycetota bacterium]
MHTDKHGFTLIEVIVTTVLIALAGLRPQPPMRHT